MYPQKIEVLIYRNSDGSLLLKKNLQDTDNSTAIKDAVELLANNRAAEYYSTQVVDHYDVEKVKVREEKYTQTVKNKEATGWLVGTLIVAALVGIIYLSVPH